MITLHALEQVALFVDLRFFKVKFDGDKMAYGILVREEDDYNFFNEYIVQNQIVYETCALLHLNEEDGDVGNR